MSGKSSSSDLNSAGLTKIFLRLLQPQSFEADRQIAIERRVNVFGAGLLEDALERLHGGVEGDARDRPLAPLRRRQQPLQGAVGLLVEEVENVVQQRFRGGLGFRQAADVEQQLLRHGPLLGVDVHEQLTFLGARQLVVDDDGHLDAPLRQMKAEDAMLAVDDQKGAGVAAKAQKAAFAIIAQMRLGLRREDDGAGRRPKTLVDIFRDLHGPATVEQSLEAVDRIFGARVGGAAGGEHVARERQRIEAMPPLRDDMRRLGDELAGAFRGELRLRFRLEGVEARGGRDDAFGLLGGEGRIGLMRRGGESGLHARNPDWRNFCRPRGGDSNSAIRRDSGLNIIAQNGHKKTISSQFDVEGQFCLKKAGASAPRWRLAVTGCSGFETLSPSRRRPGVKRAAPRVPALSKQREARFQRRPDVS